MQEFYKFPYFLSKTLKIKEIMKMLNVSLSILTNIEFYRNKIFLVIDIEHMFW